ncbi:MAG: alpha/beta hydrolase [Acidimicrobiales bacterium]|nr:alpha/beta hydrolase [Acidimicrobiales bacterium]
MPLEPRLRPIVALYGAMGRGGTDVSYADQRVQAEAMAKRGRWLVMPRGPKMASERDLTVPVDGGQIRVRLYQPDAAGPLPLHVFLHGGGWCVGSLYERDPRCREIAAGARATVASVEYRLAPENAYPVPAEDCYAALTWLVGHADELRIDPSRIGIGGESAGANLAAAVCLMARDRGGPAIAHQWLDVPAVDARLQTESMTDVPDGNLLDLATIHAFRDAYFQDPGRMLEPYGSPLLADSHEGLAPAWIMSAEFDKLRDDGRAYAHALEAAGVPVEFRLLRGHVHPSFAFTRLLPSAKAYEREAIAALGRALHP